MRPTCWACEARDGRAWVCLQAAGHSGKHVYVDGNAWVHDDDPLECGVRLPAKVINAWKRDRVVADWKSGMTLRALAAKHDISHETARQWTRRESR